MTIEDIINALNVGALVAGIIMFARGQIIPKTVVDDRLKEMREIAEITAKIVGQEVGEALAEKIDKVMSKNTRSRTTVKK
jgi:hypothetical protein